MEKKDFHIGRKASAFYEMVMAKIRILPDRVANQIAAGEVVERPAAVVKELIENSIDAGATKIEIEFRNGGKSYLRVEDDGLGMNPDQALLCLERHATSKIRMAKDLDQIQTFGFRGEALPSISSVSRFTLRTRIKSNPEGSEILINGGRMIHVKECGMPVGTRIEVAHLFNSVPVRRKFLKTEVTESSHIIHLSKLYALSHPEITFSLIEGGRTLFHSPRSSELLDRVKETFGKGLADSLTYLEASDEGIKLSGLLGKPGFSRPSRKEMIFFVNRRPIESKTIAYALLEAYHTFAPKGRFPPAVLFLDLDPSLVDVNIHPAKREIRFREEIKVRTFLIESILQKIKSFSDQITPPEKEIKMEKDLISGELVPKIDPQAFARYKISDSGNNFKTILNPTELNLTERTREEVIENELRKDKKGEDLSETLENSFSSRDVVGLKSDLNATWRLIDHSYGNMAIFNTSEGIVLFHCNAALERIRFEQLEDCFTNNEKKEGQSLLLPESIELDGVDTNFLKNSMIQLENFGFEIEEFGRNFFRIEACPTWLDPEEAKLFILDFIDLSRESGADRKIEVHIKEALIKQLSKKREIKKGYSETEIVQLANELLRSRNPYTCPQGRPIYFELPIRDFENRFRRKL